MKKTARKTVLAGARDDENNFDQQPIAPSVETVPVQKRMSMELAPYSFVMLELELK